MGFHIPHDWPHPWTDDPSVHHSPPPARGAAHLLSFVARTVAATLKRLPMPVRASGPGGGRKAERRQGLAMPRRPF
ncbi:hypothetical protein ACTDI4_01120 [Mesorhizobium sp. PUT5]|uniref:hypothetical protein n=1 Tax=Mesorhizobium sp. PUT5 TaxID=3454629 RepID=UPI003FA413AD